MNLKLNIARSMITCFGLSALLLCVSAGPLVAQIPADELPPSGTDTGLEGKYDPQNGIAQVVRGEMKGVASIFQDDHVVVLRPPDTAVDPSQLLVVAIRRGARKLFGHKTIQIPEPLAAFQHTGIHRTR